MAKNKAEQASEVLALERKYDHQFKVVFDAIRELMTPQEKPRRRIGFHAGQRHGEPRMTMIAMGTSASVEHGPNTRALLT